MSSGDERNAGSEPAGVPSLGNLTDTDALDVIAHVVDQACETADPALIEHSFCLAEQLSKRGLQPPEAALLDYFMANAWACRHQQRLGDRTATWDFDQPEAQQQVFLLRRAAHSPAFPAMAAIRRCQVLTNLGNQLDTLGRFIDARACWSAALAIDSNFWMARANRGRGLMYYAAALYDPGHAAVFALHAHSDLVDAVSLIAEHPQLGDYRLADFFAEAADRIANHYDLEAIGNTYNPEGGDLGKEEAERAYRRWCLENVLFLNPLNDVETAAIAARDILTLPDFVTTTDEPPIVVGMFNELKQSFVSARWMLWEGMRSNEPHVSDREVLLYNTLDYPAHGLAVERVKVAFRTAYSILDKIAYFLNYYLALGIPEKRVTFRSIWREKDNGPVRDYFAKSDNWSLRGLFWLSKDLFEESMRDSTEPEARALADLRNHLEHKYVKVHEILLTPRSSENVFADTLAHAITRSDLELRTLRLMQLVRSALIYLSLGMHREERERATHTEGIVATIQLDPWQDEWKR